MKLGVVAGMECDAAGALGGAGRRLIAVANIVPSLAAYKCD